MRNIRSFRWVQPACKHRGERVMSLSRMKFGFVALLVGISTLSLAQPPVTRQQFRIALAGDSTIVRRMSVYDDPAYLQMIKRIRDADVAFH